MLIPFTINVYERGASGAPTVNQIDNLARCVQQLDWTISDQFGFESATAQFTGTPDDAMVWFGRLGCNCVIFGPSAERCWEGQLVEAQVTMGQEQHSRSLEGMANRWDVRYTTVNGVSLALGVSSNTDSTGIYGTKDDIATLDGVNSTEATNIQAQILAAKAWPVRRPASEIATGLDAGQISITLRFAGWYDTLAWIMTSRNDSTSEATTTQLGDLISASGVGIGVTNAFLSTLTTRITASGINASRFIAENTTYRQKIEALLSQGNSSNQRLAWGVYEGRQFVVEAWAGATPSTLQYIRWLGSGVITNPAGGIIDPWNVRPNAMYQVSNFSDSATRSAEQNGTGRYYVARVQFRIDANGYSVSCEPTDVDDLSARLARLGRTPR